MLRRQPLAKNSFCLEAINKSLTDTLAQKKCSNIDKFCKGYIVLVQILAQRGQNFFLRVYIIFFPRKVLQLLRREIGIEFYYYFKNSPKNVW